MHLSSNAPNYNKLTRSMVHIFYLSIDSTISTSDIGTTSTEMDLTPHNTDSTTSIQRAYTPTTNSTQGTVNQY